jgi:ABC-type thiamin/hydroxymethylpyrimidine transport system permease subunit
MTTTHLILRYVHISAGVLTLTSGAAAMTLRKGSPLHRRAGNVFFVSMLILSAAGVVLSLIKTPNMGNIMGGTTAFYMVATAWATVIRKPGETGRFEIIAALAGFAIAAAASSFGIQALNSPRGLFYGYPALMYFIFASVLFFASALDARMIARGGFTGTARITRHLSRMCLAFFMATGSFFFGQPRFLPAVIRETALRPILALLPLGLLLYWLVRIRAWPSIRKAWALRQVPETAR